MRLTPVSVDGTNIGPTTDYGGLFPWGEAFPVSASIEQLQRPNLAPLLLSVSPDGRTIPLELYRRHDAVVSSTTFNANVKTWFDPRRNSAGPRTLVVTGDDGSTQLRCQFYVAALEVSAIAADAYRVTLVLDPPWFEANNPATSAANPATVTNTGTTPALPSIALTTGTHVTRRASTVAGAGAGGGVIGYPIALDIGTGLTASQIYTYIEGVNVPNLYNSAKGFVYVLVDTAGDGVTTTAIDVVYGTGLANPLAGTLDTGGMDWASANFTNTNWVWNDWRVSTFPPRVGSWRPALTGNHNGTAKASYQIISEAFNSVVIALGVEGQYDNSADSILLFVGAKAGTTNALAGISRVTANLDGTNAQAYVRYRTAGSFVWQTAWSSRANGPVTSAIDLDNAVEIAIGLENDGATADPCTLTIQTSLRTELALTATPTVVVAAATNYDHYDGTYQVGTRSITFTHFLVPDGTLTLDCLTREISSSVAGPFYGEEDAYVFSDPDLWLALEPGSNTITDGLSATDVITHRDAYL